MDENEQLWKPGDTPWMSHECCGGKKKNAVFRMVIKKKKE